MLQIDELRIDQYIILDFFNRMTHFKTFASLDIDKNILIIRSY